MAGSSERSPLRQCSQTGRKAAFCTLCWNVYVLSIFRSLLTPLDEDPTENFTTRTTTRPDQMMQHGEKSMEEREARDRISSYSAERENLDSQSIYEKEERVDHREKEESSAYLASIRSQPNTRHPSHSRSQTLRSVRSYGGEDGYSCNHERNGEEGGEGEAETEESRERKRWEVRWDGENDPMSPRSISTGRRWVIVLILASSSLCVYVVPTSMGNREGGMSPQHAVRGFANTETLRTDTLCAFVGLVLLRSTP